MIGSSLGVNATSLKPQGSSHRATDSKEGCSGAEHLGAVMERLSHGWVSPDCRCEETWGRFPKTSVRMAAWAPVHAAADGPTPGSLPKVPSLMNGCYFLEMEHFLKRQAGRIDPVVTLWESKSLLVFGRPASPSKQTGRQWSVAFLCPTPSPNPPLLSPPWGSMT